MFLPVFCTEIFFSVQKGCVFLYRFKCIPIKIILARYVSLDPQREPSDTMVWNRSQYYLPL